MGLGFASGLAGQTDAGVVGWTSPVIGVAYSKAMPKRRCAFDNQQVTTIWDERYCTTAAPTISTTKQAEVVHAATAEGLLALHPWAFNGTRTWAAIETVHDATYVGAVRRGEPRQQAESQGFRWSPALSQAVARIWAGHAAACRLALREGLVFHPVSGAHHADRTSGAGFCTFNFLVGAGRQLLEAGFVDKVAIVDLDAHQGDGTWRLVRDDHRFALFDVAGSDWTGEHESDCAILRVVKDAACYREALLAFPEFLDQARPGLVEYQAGMDCHEGDPVGGIPGVDADFLGWRDRFVIEEVVRRGTPLVINLAGGYQSDGTTVRLHVQTAREASAFARRVAVDRRMTSAVSSLAAGPRAHALEQWTTPTPEEAQDGEPLENR
jgi:acetoin utilization deacetylase AcuC-like enzyme